jgi:hypothetical protein
MTVPKPAGHLTLSKVRGYTSHSIVTLTDGRAIALAVTRRLLTAATRVRAQVRSCRICGGQSGTGASFLRALRVPLPILIPLTAPHSSSIVRGWYNRPVSGRRIKWTQPHPTPRKDPTLTDDGQGGQCHVVPSNGTYRNEWRSMPSEGAGPLTGLF